MKETASSQLTDSIDNAHSKVNECSSLITVLEAATTDDSLLMDHVHFFCGTAGRVLSEAALILERARNEVNS